MLRAVRLVPELPVPVRHEVGVRGVAVVAEQLLPRRQGAAREDAHDLAPARVLHLPVPGPASLLELSVPSNGTFIVSTTHTDI